MIGSAVVTAIHIFTQIGVPILFVILGCAVLAGILQGVTQIQDRAIALVVKLGGVALVLYFAEERLFPEFIAFTAQLWGGVEVYQ